MRRLLILAAVALLASIASHAGAAEMPKDLHGVWCVITPGKYSQVMEACPAGADTMTVDARGFSVDECRVLKLTRGQAYRMTFHCVDREGRFTVEQRWDRKKGVLTITAGDKVPWFMVLPNPPIYGKTYD